MLKYFKINLKPCVCLSLFLSMDDKSKNPNKNSEKRPSLSWRSLIYIRNGIVNLHDCIVQVVGYYDLICEKQIYLFWKGLFFVHKKVYKNTLKPQTCQRFTLTTVKQLFGPRPNELQALVLYPILFCLRREHQTVDPLTTFKRGLDKFRHASQTALYSTLYPQKLTLLLKFS